MVVIIVLFFKYRYKIKNEWVQKNVKQYVCNSNYLCQLGSYGARLGMSSLTLLFHLFLGDRGFVDSVVGDGGVDVALVEWVCCVNGSSLA